jgi:hypothetical protein
MLLQLQRLQLELLYMQCIAYPPHATAKLTLCLLTRMFTYNSSHRGIRHYWGVRVRGQHTKTTGRNSHARGG